jgi:broad-specificity NMP kinase
MERGIKEVKVSELAKHAQNIDVISEESLVDLATKGVFATTNQDQINKLQGELALITGKSTMANDMRRNLQKRIDWIKSHPTQKA